MALLTIAKREFRAYFDSPVAYVIICLSLMLVGVLFFLDVPGFGAGFWKVDRASLERMFTILPVFLSLFVVPAITMRTMAEERRSGTLEMLITLPVKDSDVLIGKYMGALGLMLVLVVSTLAYPLFLFKAPWDLGAIDMNPVWSGYLGLLLFSAASVAVGLLVSSLTSSQTISFFVTLALLISLWLVGIFADVQSLPEWFRDSVAYISTKTRLESFNRGLIDTRDIVYFLSITFMCLVFSFRALERRKWA